MLHVTWFPSNTINQLSNQRCLSFCSFFVNFSSFRFFPNILVVSIHI